MEFTVMENGTLPPDSMVCNTATLTTAANPGPATSRAACVTLSSTPECAAAMLTPRTALKGVKDPTAGPDAATFEWDPDPLALEYHLNTVDDKMLLVGDGPSLLGSGVLQCSASAPTCTDMDSLVPVPGVPVLYYQAISACGPLPIDEGPVF